MALSQESIILALADSCFDLCDRFGLDLEGTVEVAHRFMGFAIAERKNASMFIINTKIALLIKSLISKQLIKNKVKIFTCCLC